MDEQGRKRVTIRKTRSGFASREQRAGFILLTGTGSLALLLGVFYLVRLMNAPFDINYEGPKFVSQAEREAQEIELQKNSDTDSDGLSDYDELYLHRTSPYLFDSDSDGISDAAELAAGDDPNCPNDQECLGSIFDSTAGESLPAEAIVADVEEDIVTSTQTGADLADAMKGASVEEIRFLLLESGVEEEVVNNLSDEELLEAYYTVVDNLDESGELDELIDESLSEE